MPVKDPFVLFDNIEDLEDYYTTHSSSLKKIQSSLIFESKKIFKYSVLPDECLLDYEYANNYFEELIRKICRFVIKDDNECYYTLKYLSYKNLLCDISYTFHWLNNMNDWITMQSLNDPNLTSNDFGIFIFNCKPDPHIIPDYNEKSTNIYNPLHTKNLDSNFTKNLSNIVKYADNSWQSDFILQQKASNRFIIFNFLPDFSMHLINIPYNYFDISSFDAKKNHINSAAIKKLLHRLTMFYYTTLKDLFKPSHPYCFLNIYKLSHMINIPSLLSFLDVCNSMISKVDSSDLSILDKILEIIFTVPYNLTFADINNLYMQKNINPQLSLIKQRQLNKKILAKSTCAILNNIFKHQTEGLLWDFIMYKYTLDPYTKEINSELFFSSPFLDLSSTCDLDYNFYKPSLSSASKNLSKWFYSYDQFTIQRLLHESNSALEEIETISSNLINNLSTDICSVIATALKKYVSPKLIH